MSFALISTLHSTGERVWEFETEELAINAWRQEAESAFGIEIPPDIPYDEQLEEVVDYLQASEWLFVKEIESPSS